MARVWFVTGSSRGIGRALVETVLEKGDSVIATSRSSTDLKDLATKFGSEKVLPLDMDVRHLEQVESAVRKGIQAFGHIDVLVNNAGCADTCSAENMPLESVQSQLDVNFMGVVYTTRTILPVMRKHGSGRILQISTLGTRVHVPGLSMYQATKCAVNGYSAVLASEVAPLGIQVTTLDLGGVNSDWSGSSMGRPPYDGAYDQTVGTASGWIQSLAPTWTPPKDMARAIHHVSTLSDQPLELLLGPDTIEHWRRVAASAAASQEEWSELTNLRYQPKG